MVRTLRESKARLSELVERASQGEDVLITVRGKVKARLTKARLTKARLTKAQVQAPVAAAGLWAEELRILQRSLIRRGKARLSTDEILAPTRSRSIPPQSRRWKFSAPSSVRSEQGISSAGA